jgi:hypothetical protein
MSSVTVVPVPVTVVPVSTFATHVKGAKELNTYIEETTQFIHAIRAELEEDLKQDKATVRFNPICRRNHHLRAETRRLAHNAFTIMEIARHDKSNFAISEATVNACLAQLDQLRKMLVNNKQQRKIETRRIKAIIREVDSLLPPATFEEFGGGFVEFNPRDDNVCLNQLRQLIETTKQHHKTVSRKILEHVHTILLAMRTHHIIAYKDAAQNAVGAVIHHAEQSRAYIRECRERALIEYCASAWWMTTQKDAMDENEYEVSVESSSTAEHLGSSGLTTHHRASDDSRWNNLEIIVKMTTTGVEVGRYSLNDDIAKFIITEEAVQSFQWEEEQMWYNDAAQQAQAQAQAPAPAQEEEEQDQE